MPTLHLVQNSNVSASDPTLTYVAPGSPLVDVARQLFMDYQKELDVDLCFQSFDEELANLPGKYTLPKGALLVATVDEIPVGCGAFRPLEGETCELKRFYVVPASRRGGLAHQMLAKLLMQARKSGYKNVVLDSLTRLQPALAFYRKYGFNEIPAYYENPEPDVVFMGRRIQSEAPKALQPYLDLDGRLERFPVGKGTEALMNLILDDMAKAFESGRDYSEREVNATLNELHTFRDPANLRRYLVDRGDLQRTNDGAKYWKAKNYTRN